LLASPAGEAVRTEKIEVLASELATADITIVQQTVKLRRLNKEEAKLLTELLNVNYILN
jgi:hypothetical protein